jgi:hypothetical protein
MSDHSCATAIASSTVHGHEQSTMSGTLSPHTFLAARTMSVLFSCSLM